MAAGNIWQLRQDCAACDWHRMAYVREQEDVWPMTNLLFSQPCPRCGAVLWPGVKEIPDPFRVAARSRAARA